jgi:ribose-phosphate pyrophosphokinase
MIYLNGKQIHINHFTDGSQKLVDITMPESRFSPVIDWRYESDEESMTLYFLTNHLREYGCEHIVLHVNYLPHARMDRVKSSKEIFTLKWMCKFINDLHFHKVYIADPHSGVAIGLLNNLQCVYPKKIVADLIEHYGSENVVLHYPDWGSYQRYKEYFEQFPACCGYKTRNWSTGKVEQLEIRNFNNIDLSNKTVIMIDDIVAKGDTMCLNAQKLKEMGAMEVVAFATHTENTVLSQRSGFMKMLEDGAIAHLYTTNSIFTGKHDKITIYEI